MLLWCLVWCLFYLHSYHVFSPLKIHVSVLLDNGLDSCSIPLDISLFYRILWFFLDTSPHIAWSIKPSFWTLYSLEVFSRQHLLNTFWNIELLFSTPLWYLINLLRCLILYIFEGQPGFVQTQTSRYFSLLSKSKTLFL